MRRLWPRPMWELPWERGTDVAIESAGVTLLRGDLTGIVRARRLSKATMKNIRQNLFFAFVYNSIGVPIAAGVLYPLLGLLLSPMLAAAAMSPELCFRHRERAAPEKGSNLEEIMGVSSVGRREFLASSCSVAAAGLVLPWTAKQAAAQTPVSLIASTRTIDVNGKAANVYSLAQPDGTQGIFHVE